MTLKLFRAVWFLSVVLVLADLLYIYAGLPELVAVDGGSIGREWLFYSVMTAIVLINVLVYLFKLMYQDAEDLRSWFHGLIVTINIFTIIALHAVKMYNSHDAIDQSRVGTFVAGSLVLVILWAASWPVYRVVQKFVLKQTI